MFGINNPFVNDDYFFANKTNRYVYTETMSYSIQQTYVFVCFVVGCLLAALIFYLIFAQTPDILKPYGKILSLVTAVDLFILINCVGVQFRLKFHENGTLLLTLQGVYTKLFTYRQLCPVMCLYTVMPSIGVAILPVQYFYRYYTLQNDKSPSGLLIMFIFFLAVAPCIIVSPKTSTIYCPPDNPNPNGTDYGTMWFEEVPVPPLFVELPSGKSYWFYANNVLTTVFYSIAVIYGILTVYRLKNKFATVMYSKSAKSIQSQLTRTMIAQSLLPLLTLIIPQAAHQITINLDMSSERFAEIIKQTLTLVPIFNMLSCIIFIKPYRRFCRRFIPCSRDFRCPFRWIGIDPVPRSIGTTRLPVTSTS